MACDQALLRRLLQQLPADGHQHVWPMQVAASDSWLLQLHTDKLQAAMSSPVSNCCLMCLLFGCLQGFMKAKRIASMWCKTPCYMLRIAQVGTRT
jgi:hypothetical protein